MGGEPNEGKQVVSLFVPELLLLLLGSVEFRLQQGSMMARLVLCHLPRQEMNGNSVSKLGDPALEPYFKPLDYVITLADIEEQLELASQEEKVPLYLEPLYLGD
ncbi:unnamed protein product [Sphagnum jensenii]|uniref:Uncharacterized protein n=1 Tax=Sphagnum jensenii TaxID=128206 RepID=A0ABP0W6N8_9BRYO